MRLIGHIGRFDRNPSLDPAVGLSAFDIRVSWPEGDDVGAVGPSYTSGVSITIRKEKDHHLVQDVIFREAPSGGRLGLQASKVEDDLYFWVHKARHPRAKVCAYLCENAALVLSERFGNVGFFVCPRSSATPKIVFKHGNLIETAIIEEGVVQVFLTKGESQDRV